MNNLKELLIKYGFSFKKALGQNFISDDSLLLDIVEKSDITSEDTVIEIGCGAGTLTEELSKKAKRVFGFEIDERLKPLLTDRFRYSDNVNIIFQDIMKMKMPELEKMIGSKYKVVANLPYYITTPIIMMFIEKAQNIESLTIMVQEEVANRLVAKENTSDYGSITSAINVMADSKIILNVNRQMFTPPPNVDSAVVKIDINKNKFQLLDSNLFKEVLRCAFNNRRKTFANNLISHFKMTREQAEGVMISLNLDLKARGETFSTKTFVEIANFLHEKE